MLVSALAPTSVSVSRTSLFCPEKPKTWKPLTGDSVKDKVAIKLRSILERGNRRFKTLESVAAVL